MDIFQHFKAKYPLALAGSALLFCGYLFFCTHTDLTKSAWPWAVVAGLWLPFFLLAAFHEPFARHCSLDQRKYAETVEFSRATAKTLAIFVAVAAAMGWIFESGEVFPQGRCIGLPGAIILIIGVAIIFKYVIGVTCRKCNAKAIIQTDDMTGKRIVRCLKCGTIRPADEDNDD